MKLKMLKKLVDIAVKQAGDSDPEVEVFHKDDNVCYSIISLGQFSIVPDVTITLDKLAKSKNKR
jgi:hypothetical protein